VGSFGYFPSYALGAIIAAQLWDSLRAQQPEVDEEIANGRFGTLFAWLRDNVHSLGAKVSIQDLMKSATGKPLSAAASLRYLESKYLESPV
jgi:carboxypeptidase Taq